MVARKHKGFTLVELLVVITIIGMLMALLLPAVNAAVEAARNKQCANNMQNLATALIMYEQRKNGFPGYQNEIGNVPQATWLVAIFEDLDRRDLATDWAKSSIAPANKPTPYYGLLVCPSDPPETNDGPWNSYVGNSGYSASSPGTGAAEANKKVANGIFHDVGVRTTIDHIIDGTSQTILVSENIQATKWDDQLRQATTFVWHQSESPPRRKINGEKTTATLSLDTARPSSFHSGGVNVMFCDRHMLFLREDVDYAVYAQLMTPNGRESDMQNAWKVPLDSGKYE